MRAKGQPMEPTPPFSALVRAGSMARWVRSLLGAFSGGKGWSSGPGWFRRGARYFFAGQARATDGGLRVLPMWLRGQAFAEQVVPVSGVVSCGRPGVISLVVTHRAEWSIDSSGANDVIVGPALTLTGAEMVEGIPTPTTAVLRWQLSGADEVIVSQSNVSRAVVPYAAIDASGRVTHVQFGDSGPSPTFQLGAGSFDLNALTREEEVVP